MLANNSTENPLFYRNVHLRWLNKTIPLCIVLLHIRVIFCVIEMFVILLDLHALCEQIYTNKLS